MAHNDYVRPSGVWLGSFAPTARDFRSFDQTSVESLNGVDGGTFAPLAPIVIGGAGIEMSADGCKLEGVTTARGGRLQLGDDDFPTFASTRTRTVVVPLAAVREPGGTPAVAFGETWFGLMPDDSTARYVELPGRMLHHGATLSSAVLHMRVGKSHSAVPASLPGFSIQRMDLARASFETLLSTGTGVQYLATPANADAYYAGGGAQAITMTPDQYNVIDSSAYVYLLAFADEAGAGAFAPSGNIFHSLELTFTGIADMAFP